MTDKDFPALGFDPAAGDVAAVRTIADELQKSGDYAGEAYNVLIKIRDKRDVWTGEAADAFVDKLDELPDYLDAAHESMDGSYKALSTWADQLADHQDKARHLEKRAQEALDAATEADSAATDAAATANTPISYPADDAAAAEAAQRKMDGRAEAARSAQREAEAAWDNVSDIRREAEDVKDRWQDDGRKCAEALREAGERAPSTGFFEGIWDAISNGAEWIADNIGDIAGIVSAIAGALSFIPVLAPIAGPIAIGAGAVALGAHATEMVVEGKWDDWGAWAELGGDIAGLVPGVKALGKGLDVAGDVVAGTDKLVDVTRTGTAALTETAGETTLKAARTIGHDMMDPSKAAKWASQKLLGMNSSATFEGADAMVTNVGRVLEGGTSVSLQGPQARGLFDDSDEASRSADYSTVGSSVLAGITAIGSK